MLRRIIEIDKDKCNGCGICVEACHEGAIQMIDGKAVLTRDDYCDGLGDCLPNCPVNAISFIEKDTLAYDEAAVMENLRNKQKNNELNHHVCPGQMAKKLEKKNSETDAQLNFEIESNLGQWPCQIRLVPTNAPYFENAKLLIAADCSAFAYGNFHSDFMKGRITIVGCPKLDPIDYSEKLTEILMQNNIKSVTVVRMEVPCCSGLANAAIKALKDCGKMIPWNVVTIGINGNIVE